MLAVNTNRGPATGLLVESGPADGFGAAGGADWVEGGDCRAVIATVPISSAENVAAIHENVCITQGPFSEGDRFFEGLTAVLSRYDVTLSHKKRWARYRRSKQRSRKGSRGDAPGKGMSVHDFLLLLENAAFSTWLRESGSVWAYPTVLTAHTLGMGILVGANAALDLRLLGVARQIPVGPMLAIFRALWSGAAISAVTGVMLFCADATTKGTTAVFFVKLGFIACAIMVAVMLRRKVYGQGADAAVVTATARALAVASLILWTGAITAGRFMAYLTPAPM